eukprot:CAMPEP_0198328662 /NCGR_PEP_ID=MMETSP1450-20131203/15609_1 /TAXON_ID=753684 ORGANISM="Madagascaria erythrocladiodes, Strain CCMP3234" /NCGR_SAMPLE_ID=MMETSP1450 /ASSEMBLY_ACC=CAM_ASM_001115 /LENGTH=303 /DNA_ID=CAMNT_0044032811 /DNA_START=77 /DNA_END=988 /DNA_ORIENTATION=+
MDGAAFIGSGAARLGTQTVRGGALCKSAFAGRSMYAAPVTVARGQVKRGQVQMNLFDRFFRVVRANLNSAVSSIEDPEKVIEQTVNDMGNDLAKLRQAYAEISATQKRLERQKQQAEATSGEWYKRAQLALKKGDEELAREALVRKQQQDEIATSLANQMGAMADNTTKLYESMQQLEGKISEARLKKDQYVARARTAKTSQKVNEMLSNTQVSGAMESFERMKDKVEELETKADVTRELAAGKTGTDVSLENRFAALEKGGAVEDELSKMKKGMKGSSTPFLMPSNPAVDAEMDKLKREQGL